jgi:acetolactate synthase-1/2/3 large subunit
MSIIKPVFLIGNGLRGAPHIIEQLCKLNVPVLTTWQGCDLIPEDSPVFCGRPGNIGQRAANIILQKSNWVMMAGARLDMETIGHDLAGFVPNCEMPIVVDCDAEELAKFPNKWGKIMMDFNNPKIGYGQSGLPFVSGDPEWLAWCKALYNRFRPELDGQDGGNFVDPYAFINTLSDVCNENDILVPGSSGMQSCAFFQAFKVKKGQRILCCNTIGAMGFEPMAIGAAIASGRRVIVVTGDGGFAQNMQELEVVRRMGLPIHYFVFSNGGYGSISSMQDGRFGLRVGSTPESGFTVPDLGWFSMGCDFSHYLIDNNDRLKDIKFAL